MVALERFLKLLGVGFVMRAGIFVFGLVASFVLLVFFSGCTQVPAYCGDGTCNGSESASTCPMDCALGTTSGGLGSAQSMPVAGAAGHGTGTGGGAGHVPGDGYLPCGTQGDWYNVGSETCCTKDVSGSVTVGYVGPISSKCCGTSSAGQWLYNPSTQVCCSGTDGAGDIGSSGSKCCGTSHEVAYNPSYSVCCFGTDGIASIGYNKNLSCCGDVSKRPYDDTKETCCIGTDGVGRPDGPRAGLDCCGTVFKFPYDSNTETCCVSSSGHGSHSSPKGQSCCGTGDIVKPYDSNTKTCCQGDDNIANVGPPKNGSCCGSYSAYPYDSNTTKCCIGKETMGETIWSGVGYTLTPSVLTDTTSCCGDEPPKLYDSNTERCCGPAISPVTCGKSGCCTASDCAENAANALISTPVCTSGQTVEWTCKNNGCEGKCVTTGNSGTQSSLKYIP